MTDLATLRALLVNDDREAVLDAMQSIDGNGCYTDAETAAEGWSPLTLEEARGTLRDWIDDEQDASQ